MQWALIASSIPSLTCFKDNNSQDSTNLTMGLHMRQLEANDPLALMLARLGELLKKNREAIQESREAHKLRVRVQQAALGGEVVAWRTAECASVILASDCGLEGGWEDSRGKEMQADCSTRGDSSDNDNKLWWRSHAGDVQAAVVAQ